MSDWEPTEIYINSPLKKWVEANVKSVVNRAFDECFVSISVDEKGRLIITCAAEDWTDREGYKSVSRSFSFYESLVDDIGLGNTGPNNSVTPSEMLDRIQECINKARKLCK